MADYLKQFTQDEEQKLARKIRAVYRDAAKDVREKLQHFQAQHAAKDAAYRKKLSEGEITLEDYKAWQRGQVFQGKQWQQKLDDVTQVYVNADEKARQLLGGTSKNVFAEAANFTAFDIDNHTQMGVAWNIYDQKTVDRLLEDNPQMLPKWKIDEKKDYTWNARRVRNEVAQGIIQGESIDKIGARLTSQLAASNADKMNMFARTAVTGAQNAGRMERLHEAQDLGIKVKKKWLATLDSRTRDSHADLDGQEVDVDQKFKVTVDGHVMEIDYPGDPTAPPELVYNCRCTLTYVYPKYQGQGQRRAYNDPDSRESEAISERTYRQWKQENGTNTTGYVTASRMYVRGDEHLTHCLSLVKPIDGYEDFGCHGSPYTVDIESNNGIAVHYNAKQFADILKADPNYKGGSIRLLSCESGKKEDGFARQLSESLGVDVMAPTGLLNIADENGARTPGDLFVCDIDIVSEMWYNGIDVEEPGKWRVYHPDGTWNTVDKKGGRTNA